MKKTFIQSLFLIFFLGAAWYGSFAGSLPVFDEEIALKDFLNPIDPKQERSLFPACQAYKSTYQVEVVFNKYIGNVTVLLANQSGIAVASCHADSAFENTVRLTLPASKGTYYLFITGSAGYEGEGSFTIK